MTEQTLTQAEMEGERELARMIESGELATAIPSSQVTNDDKDEPANPADPAPEVPAAPSEPESPAAPATPADPEQPAAPEQAIEQIDALLTVEQQALLKLTQDRVQIEEAQKALASEYSGINPALDELADKLDEGEITQGQYDKQKRALEQKREDLRRQYDTNNGKLSSLIEGEQQSSARIHGLEQQKDPVVVAVNAFLSRPDSSIYQDDASAKALGGLYQALKSMPKMSGKTDTELLELADAQFRQLNGIAAAKPQEQQQKAPPGETPEQKAARLARTIPTGVSGMPAVVTNSTSDQYSDLASKSGPEIEAAFAKMSAAEQEEFLSKMK